MNSCHSKRSGCTPNGDKWQWGGRPGCLGSMVNDLVGLHLGYTWNNEKYVQYSKYSTLNWMRQNRNSWPWQAWPARIANSLGFPPPPPLALLVARRSAYREDRSSCRYCLKAQNQIYSSTANAVWSPVDPRCTCGFPGFPRLAWFHSFASTCSAPQRPHRNPQSPIL